MDDKLSSALRSLPRAEARPGFTDAVWSRLEERRVPRPDLGHRHLARWPMRLAAAAVCLLLLVLGTREWWHHHQLQQTTARLTALENERRALVSELESLRRQMDMAQPVVYLGGNNELDLVLDLAALQRAGLEPGDFRTGRFQTAGSRVAGPRLAGPTTAHFPQPTKPTIY